MAVIPVPSLHKKRLVFGAPTLTAFCWHVERCTVKGVKWAPPSDNMLCGGKIVLCFSSLSSDKSFITRAVIMAATTSRADGTELISVDQDGQASVVFTASQAVSSQPQHLAPADTGRQAWLFLTACVAVEVLVWGRSLNKGDRSALS